MTTSFVLCADDFGLSAGIDAAILDLIDSGRLSATSVMVGGPDLPAAARTLAERADRAEIGLHLTFTDLPPLGSLPRLAPEGTPPALGKLIATAVGRRLDRAEIAAEVERQIARFEALVGRAPDFIDGHQHVHVLPGIRQAVFAAFDAGRLDRRRTWLRDPTPPGQAWIIGGWPRQKAAIIAALSFGLAGDAARHGVATNQGFLGYTAFRADGSFGSVFAAQLPTATTTTLAMCHPSQDVGDTSFPDPIAAARLNEYAYLASDRFAADLAARGLTLGRPGWIKR